MLSRSVVAIVTLATLATMACTSNKKEEKRGDSLGSVHSAAESIWPTLVPTQGSPFANPPPGNETGDPWADLGALIPEDPIMGPVLSGKPIDPDVAEWCNEKLGVTDDLTCRGADFACKALEWGAGEMMPEVGPLAISPFPPLNGACGKTALKCCQGITPKPGASPIVDHQLGVHWIGPFDTRGGCWSAYNEPSPINCEGNQYYGPTWSPGICKPVPGSDGSNWVTTRCTCEAYPSCRTPEPTRPGEPGVPGKIQQELTSDNEVELKALIDHAILAAHAQAKLPNHLNDFVTFRGCRDRATLSNVGPHSPTLEILRRDGTVDVETTAGQINDYLIAARAIKAVPNGVARYVFVSDRKWSPTQRAGYLARIGGAANARPELLKHMSTEALDIVAAANPDWEMLAVPLDGEPAAGDPSDSDFDGCAQGTATLADVHASVSGASVTLDVHAVEGAQGASTSSTPASYRAQVRWGDGTVSPISGITTSTFGASHEYARAGRYVVEVWLANSSGLRSVSRQVVTTTAVGGSAAVRGAAVSRVDLDVVGAGQNFVAGNVDFSVEAISPGGGGDDSTTEMLGHDSITLPQEQDGYGRMIFEGIRQVRHSLSFHHYAQKSISHLVIRPFRRGNSSSPCAELRLGDLGFTLIDSAGLNPRKITFRPSPSDIEVQLTTGQVVAPQINPGDGRLILPATAAVVRIAIASSRLDPRSLDIPGIPSDFASAQQQFAEVRANAWVALSPDSTTPAAPIQLTYAAAPAKAAQPAAPSIALDHPTRTIDDVSGVKLDLAVTVADYSARTVTIDVSTIDATNAEHAIGTITVPTPVATTMTRIAVPSTLLPVSTEFSSVRGVRLKITGAGPIANRVRVGGLHLLRSSGGVGAEFVTKPSFHDVVMLSAESEAPMAPHVDSATKEVLLPARAVTAVVFLSNSQSTVGCRPSFDGGAATFVTAEGGCKDTRTGLVWSNASPALQTWHEAAWGSALAGNTQPDANDDGRVNDFDAGMTMPDTSTLNYCHELDEGGKSDWYLPTYDDVLNVFGPSLAGRSFGFDPRETFNTSSSWDVNTSLVRMLDDIQSARGMGTKATSRYRTVCVRRDHSDTHVCNAGAAPRFMTTTMGCADTQTGLVWSRPARRAMTWHDAIWDSTFAGSAAPTPADGTRTNDYDPLFLPQAGAANRDASATAYCHDLVEGGISDWRMPTREELLSLKNTSALQVLPTRTYYSSTSYAISTYAYGFQPSSGAIPASLKTTEAQVICVRR